MVKQGFKRTEIGEIPEVWSVKTLSELCDVRDGTHDSPKEQSSGIPLVTSKNVTTGRLDFTNITFITPEDAAGINKRSKVHKGDIIMSMIGSLGNVAKVDEEPNFCIKNVALLKPKSVSTDFLYQLMSGYGFQRLLEDSLDGGIQKFVSLGTLRSMSVCLPTPVEQRDIAEALSDVDGLITGLEALIAKKRDIKTATMQQLLTGKKRLPGFGEGQGTKQTELGEIPEDWDVRTYGNSFNFLSTANNSRSDLSDEGEISYIHYGDIHTKIHFCLDLEKQNLPKIDRRKFRNPAFLEDGDVVMADASEDYDGIGKSIEVSNVGKKRVISGLHTFLLRDTEKRYANGFRAYLHAIPAVKRAFDTLATGLKVYGLSKTSLRDVNIPVPPFEEQEEIVKVLTGMSADLELAQKRLIKTKAIKQGMMQELLTGKTRLV